MWFGAWDNGVLRYNGERFANLTIKDGLPNNIVTAIYEEAGGGMWFGTLGGGVSRYDGEQFATFTIKDGLADDSVVAIQGPPMGQSGLEHRGVFRVAMDIRLSILSPMACCGLPPWGKV